MAPRAARLLTLAATAAATAAGSLASGVDDTSEASAGAGRGLCRDAGGATCARDSALLQLQQPQLVRPGDSAGGEGFAVECTLRDFKAEHPDFYLAHEGPPGRPFGLKRGCVETQLGPDRKPVYREQAECFHSRESFAQWYNDVPGVNKRESFDMEFVRQDSGMFMYDNAAFFPMDGRGWADEAYGHNYYFTMELHTSFIYHGGEHLHFRGDDDVWVFIDGKLALDLGGIHTPEEGSVTLDTLQLTPGTEVQLDLFFAERQVFLSNFRIETEFQLAPAHEGSCMLWGDPHAKVFDSTADRRSSAMPSVVDIFGHGDYWVVKNQQVSIQGRYGPTQWTENGLSATLALAVGGPFLQGHTLIIEPRDGQITWDGRSILKEFPSEWAAESLITARYHEVPEPVDKAELHRPVYGVDVQLPLGVRLTVNRWRKHLDVIIQMRALVGGQDGHCGNFNQDSTDDTAELIKARMELKVSKGDLLFPSRSYHFEGCFGQRNSRQGSPIPMGDGMTLQECAAACRGSAYFGMRSERECLCGSLGSDFGKQVDSSCGCENDESIEAGRSCVYVFGDRAEPEAKGLAGCTPEVRAKAEAQCSNALGGDQPKQVLEACVFDRCFGGSAFDAESP